jgi:hypothetical protein
VLSRAGELGSEPEYELETRGGFVEYRPLVRRFVSERAEQLRRRADVVLALEELEREPAARIFGRDPYDTLLVPLLLDVVESCGGFDWDDIAFERAYVRLERALFGGARTYRALAPVLGISAPTPVELVDGFRLRPTPVEEIAAHGPGAARAVPPRFGRDVDRWCALELEILLGAKDPVPDGPMLMAAAVRALRLATGGPVAATPVVEWIEGWPLPLRPPVRATALRPPGEPTRLDAFRAEVAVRLLAPVAGAVGAVADELDRWEASLLSGLDVESRRPQLVAALAG